MTETIGFAGLAFNRTVGNSVIQRRVVSYISGTSNITPHTGTGNCLGVVRQSGNPGDVVQVLEYGIAEVEFDNTPIAGNVATINGDKAHDSGLTALSAISTASGVLGRIGRLRADIGSAFADVLVLFPAASGLQIQAANVVGLTGNFLSVPLAITAPTTLSGSSCSVYATSGTFTQPIPDASLYPGVVFNIVNAGPGTITLTPFSGQTLMGQSSIDVLSGCSVGLQSTGNSTGIGYIYAF